MMYYAGRFENSKHNELMGALVLQALAGVHCTCGQVFRDVGDMAIHRAMTHAPSILPSPEGEAELEALNSMPPEVFQVWLERAMYQTR